MPTDHTGYFEYNEKMHRFDDAMCAFKHGQLDIEATGSFGTLKLYGIPFPDAKDITELTGRSFGPDSDKVFSDPIAEGGIEMGESYLTWVSLAVRCSGHNTENETLSVAFQGEAEDPEWGDTGQFDGLVVCDIRDSLF